MKKNFNKLIIIITIMLILTACTEESTSLTITIGENQQIVESYDIYNHPDAISFPAVVRSSGEKPYETEYKGVELSLLFTALNIDIKDVEKITLNAIDGYRIIISSEEFKEPKNVYLTFERDGEYLKSKKQGGNGPYQLIIRRDPFSQRWVKHVNEIILE